MRPPNPRGSRGGTGSPRRLRCPHLDPSGDVIRDEAPRGGPCVTWACPPGLDSAPMRLILAEFNELSPVLMDKFIAAGKLPNFERLRRESEAYLTAAGEEQDDLEPWIQWVTVHSGLTYSEHGIRDLGDGYKLDRKNVWDLLSDAGKRVWVCGSMNV